MLNYDIGDAWLMNESLGFYMSTNTFRNPIFDTSLEQPPELSMQDTSQVSNIITTDDHNSNNQQHPRQSSNANGDRASPNIADQHNNNNRIPPTHQTIVCSSTTCPDSVGGGGGKKLADLRDNLTFSIRSKLFVIELNFKRRLHGLKKFLDRNMPWVLPNNKYSRISLTRENSTMNAMMRNDDCLNNHDDDQSNNNNNNNDQLFWWDVQPDSPKSLEVQQERLLNRLEKVKRDRQRLFNMERNFASYFQEMEESTSSRKNGSLATRTSRPEKRKAVSSSNAGLSGCGRSDTIGDDPDSQRKSSCIRNSMVPWVFGAGKVKNRSVVGELNAANKTTTSRLCIVCYENTPNIETLPCKHQDICTDCFIETIYMVVKHRQYPLRCVLCRQKIVKIRCSRSSLLKVKKGTLNCTR